MNMIEAKLMDAANALAQRLKKTSPDRAGQWVIYVLEKIDYACRDKQLFEAMLFELEESIRQRRTTSRW